jgi:methylglyoxal synthase
MSKQLTIALVAHDNRKADMVEWALHNAELMITSSLWDNDDYVPTVPRYVKFQR